jgi:hypothetical protein
MIPRWNSRIHEQSPLKLFARIWSRHENWCCAQVESKKTCLATRMMPQVFPINFEPDVIIKVDKFMGHSTLHMIPVEMCSLTEEDVASLWMDSTSTLAGYTVYI